MAKEAGGKNRILTLAEKKGYSLSRSSSDYKKTIPLLTILAGTGELHQMMPSDPRKKKQIYEFVLNELINNRNPAEKDQTYGPNFAADFIGKMIKNKEFQNRLAMEYLVLATANQKRDINGDGKIDKFDESYRKKKKDLLQLLIRKDKGRFNRIHAGVVHALRSSSVSPELRRVEEKMKFPNDWTKGWQRRGGKLIRKTIVAFGSNDDKREYLWFNGFQKFGGGKYRVVSRTRDKKGLLTGFVLEGPGNQFVPGKGSLKVIDRIEVLGSNLPNFQEKIAQAWNNPKVATVMQRGHSGAEEEIFDSTVKGQNKQRQFLIAGACWGAHNVANIAANKHPNSVSMGTTGTGKGVINDVVLRQLLKNLGRTNDVSKISKDIGKNLPRIGEAKYYTGFSDGIISDLMKTKTGESK